MLHRIFISLFLILFSLRAAAHQTELSSTLLINQGEKWVLQLRASLTAFEYVVDQHYGENAYSSPEEFQELLVDYLRKQISIRFNDGKFVELMNPGIALGHETKIFFSIKAETEDIHSLSLKNQSFEDIDRNQSALIVVKEGFPKRQFMMNAENGHRVKLALGDATIELISPAKDWGSIYLPGFGFLLLAFSLMVYSYKRSRKEALRVLPIS